MSGPDVQLRRLPYPYRAMLAVCSDLDETPDRQAYWEIARFLNTTQDTPMGPGVGLEVGNTIYFDMPPDQFAYWNTDDAGRAMVRSLIRSGHIDCLHSFGDLATTRAHAARSLDELARHDCYLKVWIDHAVAPTNLDPDIMKGHGDEPGHAAYHADLTTQYGVRFVWRGRVTSVVGQDVPPRFGGLFRASHPVASLRTLAKERVKHRLARQGNAKYAMHAPNRVTRPVRLRDGTPATEFIRCNPHWGGVSSCDTGREIGQVLTAGVLRRLVEREGVCILYTHLGKVDDPRAPFGPSAVAGFRRLAEARDRGEIFVCTTRRLLGYLAARDALRFTARRDADTVIIEAEGDWHAEPFACAGLSFYVPQGVDCRLLINGRSVENVRRNPADHTGRGSVSVPWPSLEFPSL